MELLRGIPNKKVVVSWGTFDLANQSFVLIINTLLFSGFVEKVVMAGDERGKFVWGLMGAVSLGVVALCGPILGALADGRSCKKKVLVGSGCLCAAFTMALAFIPAGSPGDLSFAIIVACLLYIPANITYSLGENFLASFLPEISTRETMGRISAFGWAMGYVGAMILLIVLAIASNLFGIEHEHQYRPFLFFAGIWFAIMIIPTILYLPERKATRIPEPGECPVRAALQQFLRTIREASRFRDLATLLASFFLYGMGVQVISFFAGLIARENFGFGPAQLFIFCIVVTFWAVAAALFTGFIQDRAGHKATLLGFLGLWLVVSLGLLLITALKLAHGDAFPVWPVWVVGAGVGLGLGGIGTATRAAVGVLTPTQQTAEFFGLWGTTYKLAGVAGLPIFGWTWSTMGAVSSLIVLTSFFVLGGLLLWWRVNMERGAQTALAAEVEAATP